MTTGSSGVSTRDGAISGLGRRDDAGPINAAPSPAAPRGGATRVVVQVGGPAGTGDVSSVDPVPTPARLLSVAELQGALRAARTPATVTAARNPQPPSLTLGRVGPWVAVLGAHGGSGASTVALALADAAAAHGHVVRLMACAVPARSGMLAVTTVELGVSDDGHWRSGRRGAHLTVDRFSGSRLDTAGRPTVDRTGVTGSFTVVDVDGDADGLGQDGWLSLACAVVLVFRVTVPGVQQADRILRELEGTVGPGRPACLVLGAAVGPRRWPGPVMSSAGPLLQRRRSDGLVVTIPVDRQLEVMGLTSSELPKAVLRSAEALLVELAPAMQATQPVASALQGSTTPHVGLVPAAGTGPLPGALLAKENCA